MHSGFHELDSTCYFSSISLHVRGTIADKEQIDVRLTCGNLGWMVFVLDFVSRIIAMVVVVILTNMAVSFASNGSVR